MQEASFTGFIKTIFIFFCVYYVFKILFRIFTPIILQRIVRKAERNFRAQYNQYNQKKSSSNEYNKRGASTSDKPKETKKIGDYVDYEEID